jgi:hypothetical protein
MKTAILLLLVISCAATRAPSVDLPNCETSCKGCEEGCDDPNCENKCYAWNSECCMNQGRRGIAFRCGCW